MLKQRLTGGKYLGFMRKELPLLLQDVPVETERGIFYHYVGAPSHSDVRKRLTGISVPKYLDCSSWSSTLAAAISGPLSA
jgi:hypothetical protein